MRIVRAGNAAATIRDVAASTDCGLVITGVACHKVFGRFLLGSTVECLAHTLPQHLLVVRNRTHGPYQRIMVATDFSDSSRHALSATASLFPGRELILYHACQIPLSGISGKLSRTSFIRDIEQAEYADFLTACELDSDMEVRPVIKQGVLETLLTQYVRNNEIDLVVMGTHGRSGVMSILLGSSAAKLLSWLPCDALVVREPRAAK